jgi:protein ImuB
MAMRKLYACIISKDVKRDKEVLLSVAQQFSSGIEMLEDGVLFDISGLGNLIGDPQQITQRVLELLQKNSISGNVRIADTTDTAILLARQTGGPDHTDPFEAFQQLPLQDLPIEDDTLGVFDDLGISTVAELRQIDAGELIGRYGPEFKKVVDLIEQKSRHLLTSNVKESSLMWIYNLDSSIDDFEQLIFVINHGLDKLLGQVSDHGFSTELLHITFELKNKTERNYEIKTSFPTLERSFWLKLANLRISLDPPESEIVSVSIASFFTRPRPDQRGLFAVSRPEPESLLLTINKIGKLVGEDNVGIPVLLDQRLAEAFTLDPGQLPRGKEKLEVRSEDLTVAFSYFNPPVPAEVAVESDRLLFIRTPRFNGRVVEYGGVWKANSRWWDSAWNTQEWDVEVENRGVYRLCRTGNEWFLRGEYD